jgi:hypothetical protein
MGFLGLCLLFTGIALIMDGSAAIPKRDAALAVFTNAVNRATGSILLIGTIIGFVGMGIPSLACSAAGGD